MKAPVIMITGGAQGIGKVTAEVLSAYNWQVVVLDADAEAIVEVRENWQGKIDVMLCNVAEEEEVKKSIEQTIKKYNRLDALVNNAGFSRNKPIEELSLAEWNLVLSTNLTGAFLMAKYGAPHLRKAQGSIINIASTRAYMSEPNTEAYAASKGGILALTHALAISLGPEVRVNSISPGWIDVSDIKKASQRNPEHLSEADHRQHPAGRVGKPEDIAEMVQFLLSDKASFITGQDFIVDGGMTRKMIYV